MLELFYAWPHDEKSEIDAAVLAQELREAFKKINKTVTDDTLLQVARIVTQSKNVDFTFNK